MFSFVRGQTLLMGNVELMGRNPWKNENLPTSKRYEFEN